MSQGPCDVTYVIKKDIEEHVLIKIVNESLLGRTGVVFVVQRDITKKNCPSRPQPSNENR
ncbi:hypothetical protein Scep_026049 [Stephania cephalantha]|uniref:Uncharacterized protein n=1 Tax=Stephania cephalantha TaxID=152367 RepID=A0AAP0ELW6_9MAGN